MHAFSLNPEFDGRAENSASYRQEVGLRPLVTHSPLNRRAPALALAMDKMPRELCLSHGVDVLKSDAGVAKITETLQKNIAPDASGAAFRDIISFFGLHRITRRVLRWLVEGRRRDCPMVGCSRKFRPHCACAMRASLKIRNRRFYRSLAVIRRWKW